MIVVAVFIVYGLLLYTEAAIAYRRDGGRPTLIAGLTSGTLVIVAAAMLQLGVPIGGSIGLGVMLAMMGVFGSRYMKTRMFVPAGIMFVLSLVALGILFKGLQAV